MKFREVSGSDDQTFVSWSPIANRVISTALVLVSCLLQNAWCQEKCLPRGAVHALGPFRGTAPRGGHSALPRGESGVCRVDGIIGQILSSLSTAEGASPAWAETRGFRPGGARSRGQLRRAIAPDRGQLPAAVRPQQSPMRFSNIMSL